MDENKLVKYKTGQLERLSNVLELTNALLDINFKKLSIVHLDDHRLFRKGLKMCLLKKFPNVLIEEFSENIPALDYIKKCYRTKRSIDLIITDFNHPGSDGLVFAKEVRELQKSFLITTPLMLISMYWNFPPLTEATKNGIFDIYLPKSASGDEIISFIKERLR